MKQKITFSKLFQLSATVFAFVLLLMQPAFATTNPAKKRATPVKNDPIGDEPLKKEKASLKSSKTWIRIYPDPLRKIIHVVARQNKGKEVDFFVFDLEGTLVLNYRMKPKDHHKIAGLPKGSYVYNVFYGDIQTASGNFEIK